MFPVIARNPTCSTNRFNGFPIRSILIPDRKPVGCIHPSTVIYAVIAYPDSGRHRQPITFRPTQPRNHTKKGHPFGTWTWRGNLCYHKVAPMGLLSSVGTTVW